MSEDLAPPLSGVAGRRMFRRRWDAWYEGVFDAMEEAERVYASGARLPPEDNEMFWAWAHESFQRQGFQAAEETQQLLEELKRSAAGDDAPLWDGETWSALGRRSYARGYAWALHVELRRLTFGVGGVLPDDRDAYQQARGQSGPLETRPSHDD